MPWPAAKLGLVFFLTLGWAAYEPLARQEQLDGTEILKLCQQNAKIKRVANRTFPGVIENEDSWKAYEPRFNKPRILVSIPNGVSTFRDGKDKPSQDLVAAIGEWLNTELGIPLIRLLWASEDPDFYDVTPANPKAKGFIAGKPLPYKKQLDDMLSKYDTIKAVIDLHAADLGDHIDLGIGTGTSAKKSVKTDKGNAAIGVIKQAWTDRNLKADMDNEFEDGGCCEMKTVTRYASQVKDVDAFRLRVNTKTFVACDQRQTATRDPFKAVLLAIEDTIFALTAHYDGCVKGFSNNGNDCIPCSEVKNCEKHKDRCYQDTQGVFHAELRCHECQRFHRLDQDKNECVKDNNDAIEKANKTPRIGKKRHPSPQAGMSYSPLKNRGATEMLSGRTRTARGVGDGGNWDNLLDLIHSIRESRAARAQHDEQTHYSTHQDTSSFGHNYEPPHFSARSADPYSGSFHQEQPSYRSERSINPFSPFYQGAVSRSSRSSGRSADSERKASRQATRSEHGEIDKYIEERW